MKAGAGGDIQHDHRPGRRTMLLYCGLQLPVGEVLNAQVDRCRQLAARARRLDGFHVLDDAAEPVLQDLLLAWLTGQPVIEGQFEAFLARVPESVIVVLDEAYVDFVEPGIRMDARKYLNGSPAVVALRTFSKAYGLAGLRIGYGLMNREVAGYINRVRQPFNVNTLAQLGARGALSDDDHYNKTYQLTKEGIAWLDGEVTALGCKVFPTQTNFFLIDVGMDCKKLYEAMLHQGVIVRPMAAYDYPSYIRIPVGLPAENQRFVKALEKCLNELRPNR